MLSDACHDFVAHFGDDCDRFEFVDDGLQNSGVPEEDTTYFRHLVTELMERVEGYSKIDTFGYAQCEGSRIDALRRAGQRVLSNPDDKEALLWLLVLAECVRSYYDGPGSILALDGDCLYKWRPEWWTPI